MAGRAGTHVLQYQTCWQVAPGESPAQAQLTDRQQATTLERSVA